MAAPILSISGLGARRQNRTALLNASLELMPGQNLGILGPNGSGKTTLLLCAAGLLKPFAGAILFLGQPIGALKSRHLARNLALAGCAERRQHNLTLWQHVLLGRFPWLAWLSFYSAKDKTIARMALEACGLASLAHRPMDSLSAGQIQLASLARALAQIWDRPRPLLLLDEMSANLDLNRRMAISLLLEKLRQKGWAILQAMHDCNLAALSCTHLLGLKNGAQLFYGSTAAVFSSGNLGRTI